MAKYVINPNTAHAREVIADTYRLENVYFWFLDIDSRIVSINKAEYVDRIDRIE
jgi:hypothetical protein